ncbi:phosphotyrosyl phosphatase activator [Lineolata rhizophorae]|uniref:Serine/threonine-protein phosphatase 2A activator n=1 Tax=Lineolata rhizophorae TaxID=578093 RepID=A0A6A6NPT7_9PEZI|nr:phosphotyrosyl phosphatase activator [Lineolata rhizophorae]
MSRRTLARLDPAAAHAFAPPVKRIHDGDDVSFFLGSTAYADIMTFIFQLNAAMFPQKSADPGAPAQVWRLGDQDRDDDFGPSVAGLRGLLAELEAFIAEAPPDPGPRRFGNVSFRAWYELVISRAASLLDKYLPARALSFGKDESTASSKTELQAYFLGSFGSAQRLDYGTGHELSFLAFLGCLWKFGVFPEDDPGVQERAIVLGVFEPYLRLVRKLILTYTLEPAGSHGVWGLDDHFFLPYIFGSAQLSPAISSAEEIPPEGSVANAPKPADVAKASAVERERKSNMYFSAIGFIYDVKKGPFWEHSPILFDISGVKAGWAKINKGMLKMYNAEVLSKFPVVQHFPFGSLFAWEKDPAAMPPAASAHTTSQPQARQNVDGQSAARHPAGAQMQGGTRAPWAPGGAADHTAWAGATPTSRVPAQSTALLPTRAPWAAGNSTALPTAPGSRPQGPRGTAAGQPGVPQTRAPWAAGSGAGGQHS